ncbi:kelch domain-containing protein 4 isoform X2 [Hordeum vulgare subsp. vulgare]|uniref:kelch domain-containing protein 4 isoform X2 n=1 Tax=Hordeum vulgare subsp. vulgare TaxID=112509 RepID=UPI001D1A36E0|nr:kelch domain-containing protein 4 isoform X2 [Hordeum vulgare subsp. vulgare]
MGKKQKKPGKGKEKTERKTAKGEEKRARREAGKVGEEDDIDAILKNIQKEEAKKKEVHVEENVPAPSPRSNGSLTINPSKDTELILYGGELYNGSKTFVYGDLYRYDVEKNEWKLVSSPNSPPPRSAHQTVAWKNNVYMFGGEFTSPNQERFHHYKDFWTLDLKTNQWEQILAKGCPSARSGHRMVLYKHKIVLFGGFYDTLREVRYYNDLHVFDLDNFKWEEIKPRPGCLWPSPRSGFQLVVYQDQIYMYGGYFKEVSSDKNASEKGTVHADMWSLDPRTWEWNKVKKTGMPPGPRAGFSMCVHKKRAVLFGGVVDMEVEADVLMSMFMNELYGFQLDNHRWYPLELRKDKPAKNKTKDIKRKETANDSESNIGNEDDDTMDYSEEATDVQSEVGGVSNHLTKSLTLTKVGSSQNSDAMSDSTEQEAIPEAIKPIGRINASMAVGKDTLYLYGGMMEVKDREITLDDLYSLNLSKLDEWKCIIPASESEWLEMSDDDDEDEDEDDEDDSGDDAMQTDEDEESDEEAEKNEAVSGAVSLLKGERKKLRRKEKRARIEQIRVILGLSDSQRTPTPGESLRDFYKRTNMYWQMAAYEHTQHTGKELRKDGFDLAETRFKELKPILDELAVLEAEQKAEEEASASTGSKKDPKKGKQKSAGR